MFVYYIDAILRDSNKLIIANFILKGLIIIFLILALQEQSSSYYVFLRWVLFLLFSLLAFISQQRDKIYSIFLWVFFAILFNPFIPFYLHDYKTWQSIDAISIFSIGFSLFLHDFTGYNSPLEIANHIHLNIRRSSYEVQNDLNDFLGKYYLKGINETDPKLRHKYFNISEHLIDILLKYSYNNIEYRIKRGIVRSKLYDISHCMSDFKHAQKFDNNIVIPDDDVIYKLTFDNYKNLLY